MNEAKEIQRLLKQAQSYFGKDEQVYIFKRSILDYKG